MEVVSVETQEILPAVSYLEKLTNHHLLTVEEEKSLVLRAQAGDQEAGDKLVLCNIRLVAQIAWAIHGIPLEDAVQEGAVGLMAAIEKFDAGMGYRFATY